MLTLRKRKTKIGPRDHGRKMSLKDFEFIETEEGYHYELSRGYITVSEAANFIHGYIVSLIRNALGIYHVENPGRLFVILHGHECKLLIPAWESERHPDLAVYLTKPTGAKDSTLWRRYVPELVIEVVSERSADRDYIEKREEYWQLGIKEYWIVDTKREQVILFRRGKSDWAEKRLDPDGVITSKLLPGFKLPFQSLLQAAAELGGEED